MSRQIANKKPMLYGKFSKESMNEDCTWTLYKNDKSKRIPTREFRIRAYPEELNGTQGLEKLIELNEDYKGPDTPSTKAKEIKTS